MAGTFPGPLANKRHEQFCLLFVQGKSQGEAYRQAGYKDRARLSAYACATRLMRDVKIRRRINELQSKGAEAENVTLATLLKETAEAQREAMKLGQPSAAVAAITAKAKLAGLWVERSENTNLDLHYTISDSLPSEEQWEAERVERLPDASRDIQSQAIEKKTP